MVNRRSTTAGRSSKASPEDMIIVEKISGPQQGLKPFRRNRGKHAIGHKNWIKSDHVHVSFDIEHDGKNIYLTYYVKEPQVRAVNTMFNSPVWEDSCVEFFFSLKGDESNYYNFEINAIGTVLGAYGKDRNERTWLPSAKLEKIETKPSLGRDPFDLVDAPTDWNLWVRIPIEVLAFSKITDISGADGYANFYKCGDKLKEPHYLSWNPVLSPQPDFHLPRYFGHISFF
jgi:hypothetical protein